MHDTPERADLAKLAESLAAEIPTATVVVRDVPVSLCQPQGGEEPRSMASLLNSGDPERARCLHKWLFMRLYDALLAPPLPSEMAAVCAHIASRDGDGGHRPDYSSAFGVATVYGPLRGPVDTAALVADPAAGLASWSGGRPGAIYSWMKVLTNHAGERTYVVQQWYARDPARQPGEYAADLAAWAGGARLDVGGTSSDEAFAILARRRQ